MSHVYFIRAGETHYVKIGVSGNVAERIKDLQASNHEKLTVLGIVPARSADAKAMEARIHEAFSDFRIHGEWFLFDDELIDMIRYRTLRADQMLSPPKDFIFVPPRLPYRLVRASLISARLVKGIDRGSA